MKHPVVLFYDVVGAFRPQISFALGYRTCVICGINVLPNYRFGIYSCIGFCNCILHIECATSDPRKFKSVLGREATFPTVVLLPMVDEYQSIVRYARGAPVERYYTIDDDLVTKYSHYSLERLHNLIAAVVIEHVTAAVVASLLTNVGHVPISQSTLGVLYMLPKNVTHKFDPHPLHLITNGTSTSTVSDDICEICENGIDHTVWYYGCKRCDQSFHVDCIPCLGMMYKIKSLASVGHIQHDR